MIHSRIAGTGGYLPAKVLTNRDLESLVDSMCVEFIVRHIPVATHLRFVERHSRKLARTTFYAMGRWQAKLEKKQAFLGRIVDIGAELYAIASAAVYANTIKSERPELAEQAFELADLFCKQARSRVDRLFDDLWTNNDDANYAAAQAVLDGRFAWVEEGVADPSGDGPMIASQPDSVDDRVSAS